MMPFDIHILVHYIKIPILQGVLTLTLPIFEVLFYVDCHDWPTPTGPANPTPSFLVLIRTRLRGVEFIIETLFLYEISVTTLLYKLTMFYY